MVLFTLRIYKYRQKVFRSKSNKFSKADIETMSIASFSQAEKEEINDKTDIDFNLFKIGEQIGRGGFGTVYICTIPPNNQDKYAVKHVNYSNELQVFI